MVKVENQRWSPDELNWKGIENWLEEPANCCGVRHSEVSNVQWKRLGTVDFQEDQSLLHWLNWVMCVCVLGVSRKVLWLTCKWMGQARSLKVIAIQGSENKHGLRRELTQRPRRCGTYSFSGAVEGHVEIDRSSHDWHSSMIVSTILWNEESHSSCE